MQIRYLFVWIHDLVIRWQDIDTFTKLGVNWVKVYMAVGGLLHQHNNLLVATGIYCANG